MKPSPYLAYITQQPLQWKNRASLELNTLKTDLTGGDLVFNTHTSISFHDTFSNIIVGQQQQSEQAFEAIAPDANILIGFGLVVVLSIVAAVVWANEVVPVSRTKLALSKRDGDVKKYLDELKEGTTVVTTTSSVETLTSEGGNNISDEEKLMIIKEKASNGRDFERWLFTDWLENNKSAGKPGRKKEPALPILKSAKWNSGDNPVLVTFALMMVGVVIASITERAGGVI